MLIIMSSYRPGVKHLNADGLSRLPLPDVPPNMEPPNEMVLYIQLAHGRVSIKIMLVPGKNILDSS